MFNGNLKGYLLGSDEVIELGILLMSGFKIVELFHVMRETLVKLCYIAYIWGYLS